MILLTFLGSLGSGKFVSKLGGGDYCKSSPFTTIVHVLGVFTFGMSIAGIRHVDSWGIAPPASVCAIGVWVSEQWANNDFYVMRSIVMSLLSGMLVQYGSLRDVGAMDRLGYLRFRF